MARKKKSRKTLRPATQLIHGGMLRSQFGETSEAIFLTQGFVYDDAESAAARFAGEEPGFIYSRFSNPTIAIFEERMRLLEGAGAARATASGMAAVTAAFLCHLKAGDHVVAAKALFGSLPLRRRGAPAALRHRPRRWSTAPTSGSGGARSGRRPRRCSWRARPIRRSKSSTSPAVAKIAHAVGARLIVDNVFATPLLQKPLELGADIVVYSATKHIDGQGRCLGGVVLGGREVRRRPSPHLPPPDRPVAQPVQRLGAAEGPGNAGDQGRARDRDGGEARRSRSPPTRASPASSIPAAPTIPRRSSRSGRCAAARSDRLRGRGRPAGAFRFANALEIVLISNNLGDAKSLITHPATTTHQRLSEEARLELGITRGHAAPLGRPRGRGRPRRGPRAGARGGGVIARHVDPHTVVPAEAPSGPGRRPAPRVRAPRPGRQCCSLQA